MNLGGYNMKKSIINLGVLVIGISLGGILVTAEEIINDQPIELTSRAQVRVFQFKSKPPKTHKGLSLVREKKVKNGYVGYYV